MLEAFLFEEACRLEQTGPLLVQAKSFLQGKRVFSFPRIDTLRRLIVRQRQQAREQIYARITSGTHPERPEKLDALLVAGANRLTAFHALKQPPGRPSPAAMLRLTDKLERIRGTGILSLDLTWLNNNYQRSLPAMPSAVRLTECALYRLEHRYAVLVCFLWQVYRDTIDYMVDMHDKLITGVYNRAQEEIDEETPQTAPLIRRTSGHLQNGGQDLLDEHYRRSRPAATLFDQVDPGRGGQANGEQLRPG